MKDHVIHAPTGIILDFAAPDFGSPEAAAIVEEWRNRTKRPREGDFICRYHQDRERSSLYLRTATGGQVIAAHWPNSGLAGSHTIVHGMTDAHRYQTDYIQRAAEDAGYATEKEYWLSSRVRLDAAIFTDRSITGVEVQRSLLTTRSVLSRTTSAGRAGALSVWFHDRDDDLPKWFGRVPSVGMNRMPWDTVPPRYSASVANGTARIKAVRCESSSGIFCRDRRFGWCGKHHPVREPLRRLFVDNIAEMVPAGDLLPMRFRFITKPEAVIYLVEPRSLELYQELTGEAAAFAVTPSPRAKKQERDRISCSADAGRRVTAAEPPPSGPRPPRTVGMGLDGPPCMERAQLDQNDPRGPRHRMCRYCGRVTARQDGEEMPWCGGEFAP